MSKKKKTNKKNNKQKKVLNTKTIENQIKQNSFNFKKILTLFLISRILVIIFIIIKHDYSIFEFFDSEHYLNMAEFGYVEPKLYAFFPLYPILIKLFTFIIPSYQISGFLISNIASFISILILTEMTKDKGNFWIIICFIFSPILGYTSLVYTESLFILLTLLGYYLYKKDKYILSAIVVGLSILTRNSGIILWGAIGLDMLYRFFSKKDKPIKFKNIVVFGLIALLIGMIYPIYLYIETGEFLKFASVQTDYWYRSTGTPIHNFLSDIIVLKRGGPELPMNIILFLQNWISFMFAFIIGIKIYKKDKTASIYTIVSLIAFTITYRNVEYWRPLASISLFRYVLGLFPVYLYLSDNKKESTTKIIYLIFMLLSIFNAITIYSGGFMG